jgi:hypothetical protein
MLRHSFHAPSEDRVFHRSAPLPALLALLALACGGGAAKPVPLDTATTPDAAVRNFLQAVADSNISRMGRYWGNIGGPASITGQPADYVQRLSVTQAFLRRSPYQILRVDKDVGNDTRGTVAVELSRTDLDGRSCVRVVPFIVLKTGGLGWIVTSIDLTKVGTPGHSCLGPSKPAPAP